MLAVKKAREYTFLMPILPTISYIPDVPAITRLYGWPKDTKKVNVFSLCLFFALFIPLSYLLQAVNIVVGAFVFEWLAYFMVSFSCQLFLFLPKVIPVYLNLINKAKKPTLYVILMATKIFTGNK